MQTRKGERKANKGGGWLHNGLYFVVIEDIISIKYLEKNSLFTSTRIQRKKFYNKILYMKIF